MRLSLTRFTTRSLMIAVAVTALALGAEVTRRRWTAFRREAEGLARQAALCTELSDGMRVASLRAPASERDGLDAKAQEYQRLADALSTARRELERRW